jgi:hypothetical protein
VLVTEKGISVIRSYYNLYTHLYWIFATCKCIVAILRYNVDAKKKKILVGIYTYNYVHYDDVVANATNHFADIIFLYFLCTINLPL